MLLRFLIGVRSRGMFFGKPTGRTRGIEAKLLGIALAIHHAVRLGR